MSVSARAAGTLIMGWLVLAAASGAVIVNVDGRANCPAGNALEVPLTAGSYSATPIDISGGGAFTAWNAWGLVSGCDQNGANCDNGWIWSYRFFAPDVPDDNVGSGGVWETEDLAFENAAEGTSFTLPTDQTVSFYIPDSNCGDNIGGVSLDVVEEVPTMPVWGGLLLAALLVGVAAWILRQRRGGRMV